LASVGLGEQPAHVVEDAGVGRGLERGVRPIGDWSTRITLSLVEPVTVLCRPGTPRA
jgi:hypothetical protein